ncbi:hypothetical protein BD311DRAFT_772053 [Dichomitus squalens]|uniref:Uncharacterized protein n=1 Tax=Dichomitus squalens TaxID=114155 RepID=A0A4V2JYK4_9APHY|nr:hypothetical protein BD311DRAFT_772053 [Dichomitus squalens]
MRCSSEIICPLWLLYPFRSLFVRSGIIDPRSVQTPTPHTYRAFNMCSLLCAMQRRCHRVRCCTASSAIVAITSVFSRIDASYPAEAITNLRF